MQVVLYARVSSEEGAQKDLSIPAQLAAMERWAQERGHDIIQIFRDDGYSAFIPSTTRPAFQEMMRFCIQKKVSAVIVWKFDRFARRIEDARTYKTLLARHGVKVVSINEPVDDSPAGFLLERSLELFAEFWPRMASSDVKRGLARRREAGHLQSKHVPFGYRREYEMQGSRRVTLYLLGPEEEVAIVRKMFDLSMHGWGNIRIARHLNANRLTRGYAHEWSGRVVHKMLINPIYCGYVYSLDSEPKLLKALHPPILSLEQWQSVQAAIKSRSTYAGPRGGISDHLLTGIIFCVCGARRVVSSSGPKSKYGSQRYICCLQRHSRACTAKALKAEPLETLVLTHIADVLQGKSLALLHEELERLYLARVKTLEATSCKSRIDGLSQKIARLYDAIEEGANIKECTSRISAYTTELQTLQQKDTSSELETLEQARAHIAKKLDDLASQNLTILGIPRPVQRELVISLVERVDVQADGSIMITFKVDGLLHSSVNRDPGLP